jgi:hypothetical protein
MPSKGYAMLRRGDVISFESAGGGGFGAGVVDDGDGDDVRKER